MNKAEEMRRELEKYVPKRVIDMMDASIAETTLATRYLERIKPYKMVYQPEIKGKGALYTVADMIKMFRYGYRHKDAKDEGEKGHKPLYKSGDVLREKANSDHTVQIKGYVGEHYKVKEKGQRKHEYYSMDYIETNYELC